MITAALVLSIVALSFSAATAVVVLIDRAALVTKEDADGVHTEIAEDITDIRDTVDVLDSELALTRKAVSDLLVARYRDVQDLGHRLETLEELVDVAEGHEVAADESLAEIAATLADIGTSFHALAEKLA